MKTLSVTVLSGEQGTTLDIGRQGEYGVREVEFDLSNLISEIGEGTAVMVHYPFKGEAYIVPTAIGETYDGAVQDDDILTWSIGQLATLYRGGGQAELRWYVDGALKKSCIYKTTCAKSLGETTEITDVQQSYIDQMAELAAAFTSMDDTPTEGSSNAVTSDGIYQAIADITVDAGAVTSVNGYTGAVVLTTSDLTNDSGYLTEHQSLDGYATEEWVTEQGYLTEHQDLSDYVTETELANAGYITDAGVTSVNGETGDVTISEATTSTAGLMSASDKSRLDTLTDEYIESLITNGNEVSY